MPVLRCTGSGAMGEARPVAGSPEDQEPVDAGGRGAREKGAAIPPWALWAVPRLPPAHPAALSGPSRLTEISN